MHCIVAARVGICALALTGVAVRAVDGGTPLGPGFVVDTTPALRHDDAAIAMAPDGRFVIAWEADAGAGLDIYARRYAADGTALGGEFRVNGLTVGDQVHPAVAMAADGSFYIAWLDRSAAAGGVYVQPFATGGVPLGCVIPVNDPVRVGDDRPRLAADAASGFAIAWREDLAVSTRTQPARCRPALCTTTVTTPSELRMRRYLNQGATALPTLAVAAFADEQRQFPHRERGQGSALEDYRLAFAADGSLTVAWWQHEEPALGPPRDTLRARDIDPTNHLSRARRLAPLHRGCSDHRFAFGYAAGIATTVYLDGSTGAGCALLLKQDGRLGSLALAQRVDSPATAAAPALALDAGGDLVVVWSGPGGYLGQRYAAGGGALGGNFAIESPPAGTAYLTPAVASDGLGNFTGAATRQLSNGTAVTLSEIVARRFAGP